MRLDVDVRYNLLPPHMQENNCLRIQKYKIANSKWKKVKTQQNITQPEPKIEIN